jgi:hypothetical protein
MANVSPLTYADGTTYLRELAYIKDWLNGVLVPGFNAAIENAIDEYQTGVTNAEETVTAAKDEWAALWQAWKDNIVLELAALNDAAMGDLIVDELSNTYTALATLIDTLTVAPDELDASVTTIVNDGASALAVKLNDLFVTPAEQTTALAGKISTTEKGAVSGVASLDGSGKVTPGQVRPVNLAGLYAARPAPTAHPDGTTYWASDVYEMYRTNGTVWSVVGAGGNELAFTGLDETVPMFSTESTEYVDVPNLTINVTAGERPFAVKFELNSAVNVLGRADYAVYVNGILKRYWFYTPAVVETWVPLTGEVIVRGLTPGTTYNVKVMVKTTSGTVRTSGAPYLTAVNK